MSREGTAHVTRFLVGTGRRGEFVVDIGFDN
jgi:hypothetical protein